MREIQYKVLILSTIINQINYTAVCSLTRLFNISTTNKTVYNAIQFVTFTASLKWLSCSNGGIDYSGY
jgi:hypothetical protein